MRIALVKGLFMSCDHTAKPRITEAGGWLVMMGSLTTREARLVYLSPQRKRKELQDSTGEECYKSLQVKHWGEVRQARDS